MPKPLTADDLLPLIAKLSSEERHRLLRLAFRQGATYAAAYAGQPVTPDEFGSDDEALARDADGWEGLGEPRRDPLAHFSSTGQTPTRAASGTGRGDRAAERDHRRTGDAHNPLTRN